MNAANEIVVEAFLNNRIRFLQMPDVIERTMEKVAFIRIPDLEDLKETDKEARVVAGEMMK
jgi:1-deoxy-D-xylulose-5-phosphate reductoisomerase